MSVDSYLCPACGAQYLQSGSCRACGRRRSYIRLRPTDVTAIVRLGDVPPRPLTRVAFPGWPSITMALNGGPPLGKVLMLFAAPGMGKSTLALGLVSRLSYDQISSVSRSLFISSEQDAHDLRESGGRCGYPYENVIFTAQSGIRGIEEAVEDVKPGFVVVDSIQQIALETGLLETISRLVALAQAHAMPMLLTCQVIKDDTWAGPRAVEHLVDGMAELTSACCCFRSGEIVDTAQYHQPAACPDPSLTFTVVSKYRYGPVGRVARLRRLASGRIEEV